METRDQDVADTADTAPVFAHRFRSGRKADDVTCACGQVTWREALAYWRRAPRRDVLRQDVQWCDA